MTATGAPSFPRWEPSEVDLESATRPELGDGRPAWRPLSELLEDRALMQVPAVVVPRFAWRGRVTVFAAREKLGKSTLLSAGAAALTAGQVFLDGPITDGSLLWCFQEHPGDFARRLVRQGCRVDRIAVLDLLESGANALSRICDAITDYRPDLCVVDSLSDAALGVVKDTNNPNDWKPVMQRFTRAARDTNCAIVLIHHAAKSTGTYRDSTEIGAGVDVIIEMEPLAQEREDTGVRKLRSRGRIPDLATFEVQFDGTSFTLANGATPPLNMRVLAYVRSHEGCSQSQVRTAVGARKDDVRREINALMQAGLVTDLGDAKGRHFHAIYENSGPGMGPGSQAVPTGSAPSPDGLTLPPGPSGPYVIGGPRDPRRDPVTDDADPQAELEIERDSIQREGCVLLHAIKSQQSAALSRAENDA